MSKKISEELARRMEEADALEPGREIPVIVTVSAGADIKALEQRGLKVQRVFESIPAVSGTRSLLRKVIEE